MAAKLLHSLTDENPELQKQIGCMTGIFQMFDRQHVLTGGRRAVGHSPKRIPPGSSYHNTGASEGEMNSAHLKSASLEKYGVKHMQERQRVSTESSRASFSSSSRSSSFSSPECNRAAQSEQLSFDKMIFSETHSGDTATSLQHPSPQFGRQTIDLRDFVKDSMYREIQTLSVKAKAIEAAPAPVAKHREPQRIDSNISSDSRGSGLDQRERTPTDLKESLRALAKLQEASGYSNEPRELLRSSSCHFKDGSSFSVSRDAPRFSYDGRGINRAPLESGDVSKSSIKLKDLPRLSLDSREVSTRRLNADSNSKLLIKSTVNDNGGFDSKFLNQKQVLGNQARPPSVVAKLMGLEMLPDAVPSCGVDMGSKRSKPDEEFVNMPTSFEKMEPLKPIQLSTSSKSSWKEPSSPRWRSPDGSMKPMSRFPIEPAPWKQMHGSKGAQKPASRTTRGLAKAPTTFPSVYSEIEKRLKDLEFQQSGKDLRALKQILEAMQTKGLLETPKEAQHSNFNSHGDDEEILLGSTRSMDNNQPQGGQIPAHTRRKATAAQIQESPIVIMKPGKLIEKSGLPKHQGSGGAKSSKDQVVNSREVNGMNSLKKTSDKNVAQLSTRSQQAGKEANAGTGKSSGSFSPRMQQKKMELEMRSRPPTSPDSSRSPRQLNKQQGDSNSPGGRRRTKNHNHQKSEDQMSETSAENEASAPARANLSTVRGSKSSQVANSERSPSLNGIRSPSAKAADFTLSDLKSTTAINEDESGESGSVQLEYSSPVSVLENVPCKQESPSPVKYAGKALKEEGARGVERSANVGKQSSVDGFAPVSTESRAAFEMNRRKLQNIENLVQKLRRLNSTHDEARTDYIASLCENTDPDHRYVSEVLLASGLLLRDLSSSLSDFQFHPSGHPINPDLFLVLEQKKASNSSKEELSTESKAQSTLDKIHRKLIFDVTNEILAQRLAPTVPHSEPWIKLVRLAKKTSSAQKLLRELCSEIDGLQAKNPKCRDEHEDGDDDWKNILSYDVMHRSGSWMDFDGEISGAVLDIERLIFKDLVNEVVNGESAGLIAKARRKKASSKK